MSPFVLRLGPRLNRAFVQRQPGIGNHQIEIEADRVAETLARRARAKRIVETEEPRLRSRVNDAVVLAFETVREAEACRYARLRRASRRSTPEACVPSANFNHRLAMTFAKTGLQRIDQSLANVRARRQSIDQHVNILEVIALVIVRRS